jgi:hypothetical protein
MGQEVKRLRLVNRKNAAPEDVARSHRLEKWHTVAHDAVGLGRCDDDGGRAVDVDVEVARSLVVPRLERLDDPPAPPGLERRR